jgi:UMP-CMP kinase
LFLDCPQQVCSDRILFRSQSSGRIDDNVNSLKKRFDTFENETIPNVAENLSKITKVVSVKSDKSPAEVFEDICLEFDKIIY